MDLFAGRNRQTPLNRKQMQKSVIEYLQKTVETYPDKVAVQDAEGSITFRELWRHAHGVAAAIGDLRNSPVGVYLPKSCKMIEAFSGISLSGNFYVPLDTKSPASRVESILNTLEAKSVITDRVHAGQLNGFFTGKVVVMEDIAAEVLADTSYTFLLVSPYLEDADDSRLDLINELYEYSLDQGYRFYCLTASGHDGQQRWRNLTGAEYPFCLTDPITLKTMIRSNPGLMLLKNGRVMRKWSHNNLPQLDPEEAALGLDRLEMGQMPKDTVAGKIVKFLLGFVLPLLLLTIADRLWMWTSWLKRKKKTKESNTLTTLNKETK